MMDINPKIVIEDIRWRDEIFFLIQEGYLPGGTKQRAFIPYLESTNYDVYIYAGPSSGYAQVALSIAAQQTGKIAVIFVEYSRGNAHLPEKARSWGAMLYNVSMRKRDRNGYFIEIPAPFRVVRQTAESYYDKLLKSGIRVTMMPFGGGCEEITNFLRIRIGESLPVNFNPKRMWLVAGSGTILGVLSELLPTTFFEIVQVGNRIWPDQLPINRSRLHIAPERFFNVAISQPPYPTVRTYDAKLWQFFEKFGQNGDYIWNVGKD